MKILKYIIFVIAVYIAYEFNFKIYDKNGKQLSKMSKNLKLDLDLLFRPKAGRDVLPIEVQIALLGLDSLHLKEFRLHGSLSKKIDGAIWQRMCESSWPILCDSTSKNVIGRTNELSTVPGLTYLFTYNNISIAKSN